MVSRVGFRNVYRNRDEKPNQIIASQLYDLVTEMNARNKFRTTVPRAIKSGFQQTYRGNNIPHLTNKIMRIVMKDQPKSFTKL